MATERRACTDLGHCCCGCCFVVSRPRKSRLGIKVVDIAVVAGCSVVLRLRKGGAGTIFAASGVAAVDGFFVATPVPKDIVGLAVAAAVVVPGCSVDP